MAASDSYVSNLCPDGAVAPAKRDTRLSDARFLQIYRTFILAADCITCSCAILLVEALHTHSTARQLNALHSAFALAAVAGALTAILLSKEPTSAGTTGVRSRIRQTEAALRASTTSLFFACTIDLTLHLHLLGLHSLLALISLPPLLILERRLAGRICRRLPHTRRVDTGHTPRFISAQRLLDIALSAPLLFLLAPLFSFIAFAIRLDSPGPSFFIQERVGRYGTRFRILKFRSMFITASRYEASPVHSFDPRITRVGRILRRLSLDELPQLINVLVGDMALVGPRPEMPFLVARHHTLHQQRLRAKPGITGLWQLSGDRPRPIHENIQHDLHYIRHGSLFLDLAILLHTLFRASCGGI